MLVSSYRQLHKTLVSRFNQMLGSATAKAVSSRSNLFLQCGKKKKNPNADLREMWEMVRALELSLYTIAFASRKVFKRPRLFVAYSGGNNYKHTTLPNTCLAHSPFSLSIVLNGVNHQQRGEGGQALLPTMRPYTINPSKTIGADKRDAVQNSLTALYVKQPQQKT